jgi:hypothetical protein
MINVATIMIQLQEWLEDDPALDGHLVERSEFLNEDAGRAVNGWIGIYRRAVDYEPRNLGVTPNNYEGTLDFMVVVQRTAMASGADCEDALEESTKAVLDRVVQLPKTYVDHFSDISIDYTYLEDERKTMYFQGALITFTVEVSFEVQ